MADSRWSEMERNSESFANLRENLATYKRDLRDIPYILQFNKRDLADIAPLEYMDFMLNRSDEKAAYLPSVASEGRGVVEALNTICRMVMAQFIKENNMDIGGIGDGKPVAVEDE